MKKGDLLLEFDLNLIQQEGYSIVTPMIITNTDDYTSVVPSGVTSIRKGETAIKLSR